MRSSLWIPMALLGAALAGTLAAQSGGNYDISWHRVSGGGVTFETGGTFSVGSTCGQQDAGTISGGTFTLNGGFWGALAPGCGAAPPVLTSPISVAVGSTGNAASVPSVGGASYAWTLTGGTITSGQGTSQILFDAGSPGTTMQLSVTETIGTCVPGPAAAAVQVDFLDVPPSHMFHDFIVRLARNGITSGCGGGNYCPGNNVTRAQMAVFLLKGEHGSGFTPPACTGLFADVACTPIPAFAVDWIEQLYNEAITGGCGTNPLRYCPGGPATRGQMAVFLVKTFNLP